MGIVIFSKVHDSCVLSVLTYGMETATLTKTSSGKLSGALIDVLRTTTIRERTKVKM